MERSCRLSLHASSIFSISFVKSRLFEAAGVGGRPAAGMRSTEFLRALLAEKRALSRPLALTPSAPSFSGFCQGLRSWLIASETSCSCHTPRVKAEEEHVFDEVACFYQVWPCYFMQLAQIHGLRLDPYVEL